MSKAKKETNKTESTYQIRPLFKDKFRPAEAKQVMLEVVEGVLKDKQDYQEKEVLLWTRDIADQCKQGLKALGKDRYKFLVQAMVGPNLGQGVRVGSRQFWDEDTDDMACVTYCNETLFCLVTAFAVYNY